MPMITQTSFLLFILALSSFLFPGSTFRDFNPRKDFPNKERYKNRIEFQEIRQNASLSECNLQVDDSAIYFCQTTVYIFGGSTPETKFSELQGVIFPVTDVDTDQGNTVVVDPTRLSLITRENIRQEADIKDENPILVRTKNKKNHQIIIIISQDNMNVYDSTPQHTDQPYRFVIHNFLLGPGSHVHHMRFPTRELDFQLNPSSFKDAVIYSDQTYGYDYLIVAIEQGRIYFFKSLFEDPQLELADVMTLKENYEILQLANSDNFLFILVENPTERHLSVEIYRINSVNGLEWQKECSLDLTRDFSHRSNHFYRKFYKNTEMRVKNIQNTFVVMINFPGSHIYVFKFQKPTIGIYRLECPSILEEINYARTFEKGKIGYSFDFVLTEYPEGIIEHGILLSPFMSSRPSFSYFLPYCMPNFYMTQNRTCMPCKEGYTSKGGTETSCEICNSLLDGQHELIPNVNPLIEACPNKCKISDKFGKFCQHKCEDYLERKETILPSTGFGFVDTNDKCTFRCKSGYYNESLGACFETEEEAKVIHNNCAQVTDCMNCSMSQSCAWCDGSCKRTRECRPREYKSNLLEDFFLPAVQCNKGLIAPCGPEATSNVSGRFTFTQDTVYKNQVCKWYTDFQFEQYKFMLLTVRGQKSVLKAWDNPINLYMKYCDYQKGTLSCQIARLPTGAPYSLRIRASQVVFYGWVEESMIGNALEFKLDYNLSSLPDFVEDMFEFMGILSRFAFFCALLTCIITFFHRVNIFNRRRRLLRELQGLELFRLVNNEDDDRPQINVEEIMENNTFVNRVVYESNAAEFGQQECPICLEAFNTGENLAKLCCKHLFHINCFQDWVKSLNSHQQVKCPVCNRILE